MASLARREIVYLRKSRTDTVDESWGVFPKSGTAEVWSHEERACHSGKASCFAAGRFLVNTDFKPLSVSEAVGIMEIYSVYEEPRYGLPVRRPGTRSLVIRPDLATAEDWLIWEGFTAIGGKVPHGGCIDA